MRLSMVMYYAVMSRLEGLTHWLRGHDIAWAVVPVCEDLSCPGDLICDTCDKVIWCKMLDPWRYWRENE